MITIKTWRDPYEAGFSPTTPREINLNPGLTVLVGCNGAGKSTLLQNIKEEAKRQDIPCHHYDNLNDGGNSSFSAILSGFGEEGDSYGFAASIFSSSEGEVIKLNLGRQSRLYKEFLKTGYYKNRSYKMSKVFRDKEEDDDNIVQSNERILLFDAVDSGLSVDSIIEIKALFDLILKDAEELGITLYLIISANEYELARNSNCFDVNTGKYITFADYEDYRKFIIFSRKKKEIRIKKQEVFYEKQRAKQLKEAKEFIAKTQIKIDKIKSKKTLSYLDEWHIRDYESDIKRKKEEFNLE